jgi:hypothetical protein
MKQNNRGNINPSHGISEGVNHRAEIRDNLDHRSNEEQNNKGNDVTHNKKDVQNARSKKTDRRK